jgi:hypothetical protein
VRALLTHHSARASAQRASADPRGSAPCAAAQPSTRQAAGGASSSSAGNGRTLEPLHELAGLSLNGARSPDLLDAPAAKPVLEAAGWGAMSAGGAAVPRQHVALPQPAAPAAPNRLRVFSGTSNMVRRERAYQSSGSAVDTHLFTQSPHVDQQRVSALVCAACCSLTCVWHFQASARARAARPFARRARGASGPLMRSARRRGAQALAQEVACFLGLNLSNIKIKRFADGEIYVQVQACARAATPRPPMLPLDISPGPATCPWLSSRARPILTGRPRTERRLAESMVPCAPSVLASHPLLMVPRSPVPPPAPSSP